MRSNRNPCLAASKDRLKEAQKELANVQEQLAPLKARLEAERYAMVQRCLYVVLLVPTILASARLDGNLCPTSFVVLG